MLIDQRVENLLRQTHGLDHLGAQGLPVHLLVVLFGVVERAIVLAERNRLAVYACRIPPVLFSNTTGTAESHVHVDETDHEGCYYREQSPLELLEVVAHQFEHWEDLSESWAGRGRP